MTRLLYLCGFAIASIILLPKAGCFRSCKKHPEPQHTISHDGEMAQAQEEKRQTGPYPEGVSVDEEDAIHEGDK